MIASFSSYQNQPVNVPYEQVTQGLRTLRQIDGTPGDKNPSPGAISMHTSQGQLDAVVFSNPDESQTVVQRLTKNSGEVLTSWLEVPKKGNGIPNLTGFEISASLIGLQGVALGVRESWTGMAGIPTRTYENQLMARNETQNALMRAEAVLASWQVALQP